MMTIDFKEYVPGAQRGDLSKRLATRPAVCTKGVAFSPTGRSWAAATTEGLLIYSLDSTLIFDPFELDVDITSASIITTLEEKKYLQALLMAFRMNEQNILVKVFESIPHIDIQLVVQAFPSSYLQKLLSLIALQMENSPHLEFHLVWCIHLFSHQGEYIRDNSSSFLSVLRNLHKHVTQQYQDLVRLSDENTYTLQYLCNLSKFFKPLTIEIQRPLPEEKARKKKKKNQDIN